MSAKAHRSARLGLTLLIGAALAACSSFDSATSRLVGVVTPYKIDVVQGNFVSREQVEALQPGMGRQQVRDILGAIARSHRRPTVAFSGPHHASVGPCTAGRAGELPAAGARFGVVSAIALLS